MCQNPWLHSSGFDRSVDERLPRPGRPVFDQRSCCGLGRLNNHPLIRALKGDSSGVACGMAEMLFSISELLVCAFRKGVGAAVLRAYALLKIPERIHTPARFCLAGRCLGGQ